MGHESKTTRQCSRNWSAIGATALLTAQTAAAADEAATQPYHAALTNHVPGFITAPGETDYLFVAVIILILVMILAIGNFYFQLHAVPERIAHRANKAQLEIVAVLALISLFTHNHLYWIIGLLLAMIRIPDFSTPLYSIARSIARIASRAPEAANAGDASPVPAPGSSAVHPPATAARTAESPAGMPPVAADPIAPTAAAPVTGAPIAPRPVAATRPQPGGHTTAQPGQQPDDPTMTPGAQAKGI